MPQREALARRKRIAHLQSSIAAGKGKLVAESVGKPSCYEAGIGEEGCPGMGVLATVIPAAAMNPEHLLAANDKSS
jgi:hypothetical protein